MTAGPGEVVRGGAVAPYRLPTKNKNVLSRREKTDAGRDESVASSISKGAYQFTVAPDKISS